MLSLCLIFSLFTCPAKCSEIKVKVGQRRYDLMPEREEDTTQTDVDSICDAYHAGMVGAKVETFADYRELMAGLGAEPATEDRLAVLRE